MNSLAPGFLALFSVWLLARPALADEPRAVPFAKHVIATHATGLGLAGTAEMSEDRAHIVYVAGDGVRNYVVKDEESSPELEIVAGVAIGRNGSPCVYLSNAGGKVGEKGVVVGGTWSLTVDGKVVKSAPVIGTPLIVPETNAVAYAWGPKGKMRVVVGRDESSKYETVGALVASEKGGHVAWQASKNDKESFIVVDGKAGEAHAGGTSPPILAPSGTAVGYAYATPDGTVLTIESLPARTSLFRSAPARDLGPVAFSPDGAHWAAPTFDGTKWRLLRDGAAGDPHDGVMLAAWSTDGAHLGWVQKDGETTRVVVDAKPLFTASSEVLGYLTLTPDGRHAAWLAAAPNGMRVVHDGKEQPGVSTVLGFSLSPDGLTLAWAQDEPAGGTMHVGSRSYGPFGWLSTPAFSDDGKQVAFATEDPELFYLRVVDANGNGTDVEQHVRSALLKIGARDAKGAREEFTAAFKLSPRDPEVLVGRGALAASERRYADAKADYDAALEVDPGFFYARLARIDAAMATQDAAQEAADLPLLLKYHPGLSASWARNAQAAERGGNGKSELKRAIELANKSLAIWPRNIDALGARAVSRGVLGDKKAGLADAEKAVSLGPDNPYALYVRSGLFAMNGKLDAACTDLGRAVQLGFENARAEYEQSCRK